MGSMPRSVALVAEVSLHTPGEGDESEFLAAVVASRELHEPWVSPPASPAAFVAYLERIRGSGHAGYLVRAAGRLVGVVNINNIVMGGFCSGQLGYYAFLGGEGSGCMAGGVRLVLERAFGALGMHRLEANIQPGNVRSLALVRRLGFRNEGFSPRYLRVDGQWRDHERWAITAEEWGG